MLEETSHFPSDPFPGRRFRSFAPDLAAYPCPTCVLALWGYTTPTLMPTFREWIVLWGNYLKWLRHEFRL